MSTHTRRPAFCRLCQTRHSAKIQRRARSLARRVTISAKAVVPAAMVDTGREVRVGIFIRGKTFVGGACADNGAAVRSGESEHSVDEAAVRAARAGNGESAVGRADAQASRGLDARVGWGFPRREQFLSVSGLLKMPRREQFLCIGTFDDCAHVGRAGVISGDQLAHVQVRVR